MSRILPATCSAGVVQVENKPVTATILSQGVKQSSGVALLEKDTLTYVASNASDIADLISQLTSLVQLLSDTLTAIGTGMTGSSTAPPPSLPTSITSLATVKTQLTAMGNNLK